MSCPSCDLYLQRLLDGDDAVLGEPDVLAHVADCPQCREHQAAGLLLLEGLRRFPKPVPPAHLNQRIAAAVLADRHQRRTWRRRYALLASAAAVFLVPFFGVFWWVQPDPKHETPLANLVQLPPRVVEVQPAPVKPTPVKTPPLRPQLEQARADWTVGLERLAFSNQHGRLIQSVSLPLEMSSVEPLTGLTPLSRPLGHVTQGGHHVAQGFALGSQTISTTTQRALSYFSRKLPPLSAPPKPPL